MLLAGDIGGTKTRLAIFSPQAGPRAPLAEEVYPSDNYPGLEEIVLEFMARVAMPVERACFGVAGPVAQGHATITNLPWVMDEATLRARLNVGAVRLLNDLESIAYAVPNLGPEHLHTLHAGERLPGGSIAVIAPGTGLGEAYLTWDGHRYHAHASEGGHATFAPNNEQEIEMLRYLLQHFDHVSYERVCSGIGIPNIYGYLRDSGFAPEPDWLAEQLAAAEDPTPIIVNTALDPAQPSALCTETLDLFVRTLGAEAGNLALKIMASGGVYLGGGIPPRIVESLEHERFRRAFLHKGRHAALLARFPIHIILDPKAALFGATCYALDAGIWE